MNENLKFDLFLCDVYECLPVCIYTHTGIIHTSGSYGNKTRASEVSRYACGTEPRSSIKKQQVFLTTDLSFQLNEWKLNK